MDDLIKKRMRKAVDSAPEVPPPQPEPEPYELPTIEITGKGDMTPVIDQVIDAICNFPGEPRIYQRGGLVHIVDRAPATVLQVQRRDAGKLIAKVGDGHIVELASECANLITTRRRKKKGEDGKDVWEESAVRVNLPKALAVSLRERNEWSFPPLVAITEHPTLRPGDWSVIERPGYDRPTALAFYPGKTKFEPVHPSPDRERALRRLGEVEDLLREFCFADETSKSVAIAMILTGLVRPCFPIAPAFGASANLPGSGKTTLAQVAGVLLTGRPAPVMTLSKKPEHNENAITSALMAGTVMLLVDNVVGVVESSKLCALTTSESSIDRRMGGNEMAVSSTGVLLVLTGNNLTPAEDLCERILICKLEPKGDYAESPEKRRFERDVLQWAAEHRGRLVPAALEFLLGFLRSGWKPSPTVDPWSRFPDWDRVIRSALLWAGRPDPLLSLREVKAADPRRIEHQAVIESWRAVFGDKQMTLADVARIAKARALGLPMSQEDHLKTLGEGIGADVDAHDLWNALLAVAGERNEINVRSLGKWMASLEGRNQSGYRFAKGTKRSGHLQWKVIK